MKKLILTSLVLVQSVFSMPIEKIMEKAHLESYYQGADGSAQILMKVYADEKSEPIKKLFYILRKDIQEGGEQFLFTYFVRPTDIKRTTFLVHKKINEDDFRRLYIPASDKVLAIAGSRKQDPFMGSDFSYEDVSGRHFSKDNHKLIDETKYQGKEVYVTESLPKQKEERLSKMKAWIDKNSYIPLKVEYYNNEGKIYRVYTSDKIDEIAGHKVITKRTMVSPLTGTKTIMLVNPKKVKFDLGLDNDVFTERALKNPPMNLMK